MTDPKDKSGPDSFSDSSELFESLFKEAPLEDEKKPRRPPGARKPLNQAQELRPKGQQGDKKPARPTQEGPPSGPALKGAGDALPPRKRLDFSRTGRKSIAPPPARPPAPKEKVVRRTRFEPKRGKISKVLKLVLLISLLGAGAAAGAGYLGFVDFGRYIGLRAEPDPVPLEVGRIRPEKKSTEQMPAEAAPEKAKRQPMPQEAEPTGGRTAPQVPETRQAVAPSGLKPAGAEEPGAVRVPPRQETPPAPPALSPKVVHQPPLPAPDQPTLAKSAPPSQPLPLLREAAPAQYPFSVYLGAYMTLERARTAVSIYERDFAVSSHWVKVDLGEKGIWYRIFTGHFRTEQEAEAFVREKQLKEGEVKRTKFSALIGVYSKPGDAEEAVRKLLEAGYSSYFVPVPGGGTGLYSGAFYTLAGAKKQHGELASKGIQSRVVER